MLLKKVVNKNKKISAKQSILTSLVVDFFDIVVNLFVAIITGSIVMVAETIHGVADFIAVLFLYIGLKRSAKNLLRDILWGTAGLYISGHFWRQ